MAPLVVEAALRLRRADVPGDIFDAIGDLALILGHRRDTIIAFSTMDSSVESAQSRILSFNFLSCSASGKVKSKSI